ncbi:hypothetical protein DFH28DRAFT_865069, partial [Melampsora americana]
SVKARTSDRLIESKIVLRALLAHLTLYQRRLWMSWSVGIVKILNKTVTYTQQPALDLRLHSEWNKLATQSREDWAGLTQVPIVEAEPLDEVEAAELVMVGDEVPEDELDVEDEEEDD